MSTTLQHNSCRPQGSRQGITVWTDGLVSCELYSISDVKDDMVIQLMGTVLSWLHNSLAKYRVLHETSREQFYGTEGKR